MTHLGSFSAAVRELDGGAERDTFDFFGEKFTVEGVLPPVLMLQLGAASTGKIDDQEAFGALWEALRCSLDANPEEDATNFNRFYKLAVKHRCELEDLAKIVMALFGAQAGRPTEGQPGSAPGLSTTSPSSSASSTAQHPAFAHLKPVNEVLGGSAGSPAA